MTFETHWSEDKMKGHWDIEIECHVIRCARHKEENNKRHVLPVKQFKLTWIKTYSHSIQ